MRGNAPYGVANRDLELTCGFECAKTPGWRGQPRRKRPDRHDRRDHRGHSHPGRCRPRPALTGARPAGALPAPRALGRDRSRAASPHRGNPTVAVVLFPPGGRRAITLVATHSPAGKRAGASSSPSDRPDLRRSAAARPTRAGPPPNLESLHPYEVAARNAIRDLLTAPKWARRKPRRERGSARRHCLTSSPDHSGYRYRRRSCSCYRCSCYRCRCSCCYCCS